MSGYYETHSAFLLFPKKNFPKKNQCNCPIPNKWNVLYYFTRIRFCGFEIFKYQDNYFELQSNSKINT